MHNEPLVSILLPTFRRPKELRKALESVVAQTYANLEILVSNNDCENEETNAVCREFTTKDKRVFYYVQPVNIGGWNNTIFLMNKAKGEYSLMMNDDDWISDNFIEVTLKTAQNDRKCVMVSSDYVIYDQEQQPYRTFVANDIVHERYEERMLAAARTPSIHGLYRTDFFREYKFFVPDGKPRYGEDWVVVIKMAFLGNLRSILGGTYHKSLPTNRDFDYYSDFFDFTGINKDNLAEQTLLSMVDSIAYDSFYDNKLNRRERVRLAALLSSKEGPERFFKKKHIVGITRCLLYLWRHPLALLKKKAIVMLEVKRKHGQEK